MGRFLVSILLLTATVMAAQNSAPRPLNGPNPASPASLEGVSFNKDVLPILQKNCQSCHRPGEAAPMSFLTYETTRPWAKAIRQAVVARKMPPWFADPGYASFKNDPSLTAQEIEKISAWVDNGAPEGDVKDKPKAIQWKSGWTIEPDVVVSIPEAHVVPAKGNGEIKAFLIPNPFKEDTWVRSIEVRPGNPSVVHHVMVQVPEDLPQQPQFSWGSTVFPCAPIGPTVAQQEFTEGLPLTVQNRLNGTTQPAAPKPPRQFAILEAVYAPGTPPMDFGKYDSAKLIPGGGDLRIEVHYTPNGTPTTDQTRVGFKLASEPPQKRFITLAPRSLANAQKLIPAGHPDWETRGELEFGQDAQVVWFMPHMHLRGKDMTFSMLQPGGAPRTVLSAKFNFDWQLGYEMDQPLRVRKGTRMMVVAHHDNSANNKYNPNPNAEVAWGDLTSQEMVLPWVGVVVDRDADPERLLTIRQNGCSSGSGLLPGLPARVPGLGGPPTVTPTPLQIPGLGTIPGVAVPVAQPIQTLPIPGVQGNQTTPGNQRPPIPAAPAPATIPNRD